MNAFAGQVALVTGASRGIGAALAEALAAAGAHVVLTARDARALEQVEERIHASGGSATIAPVDLAEPDAIARLLSAMAQRWQALDILVINAGVLPQLSPVVDIEPKAFSEAMTVNAMATLTLLSACHAMLKNSADPRVLYLSTNVAKSPRAFWGAYAASKAAGDVLVDCYAQETARTSKIRVAMINPGATRTKMRARAYPGEDPASVKPPEAVAGRLLELLGQPFESGHREAVNLAS